MRKKDDISEKIEKIEKKEKKRSKENKVEYNVNRRGVMAGVTFGICVCLAVGGYYLVRSLADAETLNQVSNAPDQSYDSGSFSPNGGSDSDGENAGIGRGNSDGGDKSDSGERSEDRSPSTPDDSDAAATGSTENVPSNMQTEPVPSDTDTPSGTTANTTIRDTGAMTVVKGDDPVDASNNPDNSDTGAPGGEGSDGYIVIAPSEGVYTSKYSDVTVSPADDIITTAAQASTASANNDADLITEPTDVWQTTTTAGTTAARTTAARTTAATKSTGRNNGGQISSDNEIDDDDIKQIMEELGTWDAALGDYFN